MRELKFSGKRIVIDEKGTLLVVDGMSLFYVFMFLATSFIAGLFYLYVKEIIGISIMVFATIGFIKESVQKVTQIHFSDQVLSQYQSLLGFRFKRLKRDFQKAELTLTQSLKGGGDGTHTVNYYELMALIVNSKNQEFKVLELQRRKNAIELSKFLESNKVPVAMQLDKY